MVKNTAMYQITPQYQRAVQTYLQRTWGNSRIWTRGRVIDAASCPGIIACREKSIVGLLTYQWAHGNCEIVTINSSVPNAGIGSALLATFLTRMREKHCTTCFAGVLNDNPSALHFFQSHDFTITAFSPDCIDQLRLENPVIPRLGQHGIPLHGEYALARNFRRRVA